MAPSTLGFALDYYLKRPGLTEADRAHLKRWLAEARDPVWERIAADTRTYGKLPAFVEGPYSYFIGSALRARQFAESQTETPAVQRKWKQQRERQDRSDLLELAEKIEDVLRHRQSCRKAQHPQRVPSPTGPLPELPPEAEAKRSLEWLGREAHRLRQVAEKVSAGEPEWDWDRIPVRVSRQSGGKGKRNQSRNLGVFMQRMVNCMYRCCGKPRYDAVATMTNIAFPDAEVVAENARSACRPTTRTGRRRSGALRPMQMN
jgi:hypothetical protein